MSQHLANDITAFLDANEKYPSWKQLPEEFLQRSARLSGEKAVELAVAVWKRGGHRFLWAAVTLLRTHPTALRYLRWRPLEEMGDRMGHWGDVDAFAWLAGAAWQDGRISDARVHRWARSPNRWWRRAALVCTVALNRRTWGGTGDARRTLAVAELLVDDRDDMVVKGMSWALRDLIPVDRRAVERFLRRHENLLAARVKREVTNKLTTGLKNPRRARRARPGR